jgi:hypothetical protein
VKQVFLSYARADARKARRLYDDLRRLASVRIWLDRIDLLPGVKWEPAIRKAIRESDYFLALLSSHSVTTRGVRHSELREALEVRKEFPEDWIYLVPTRLDDCPMPFPELKELNYADLFPRWKDGVAQICYMLRSQEKEGDLLPRANKSRGAQIIDSRQSKTARAQSTKEDQKHQQGLRNNEPLKHRFHYKVGLANLDPSRSNSVIGSVARGLNSVQSIFHLVPESLPAPRQALTTIDSTPQLYISHLPSCFYERIGPLDMDCVVCLTRRLLTFEENDEVLYNYLAGPSPTDSRVLFVSHSGLDRYAKAAGTTLAIALAYRITAELASYFLDLDYHPQTRNCPMDFTKDHSDLVGGIRAGQFCSYCSNQFKSGISRPFAAAFRAMIAWGR